MFFRRSRVRVPHPANFFLPLISLLRPQFFLYPPLSFIFLLQITSTKMWSRDVMFRQFVTDEILPRLGERFAAMNPSSVHCAPDGSVELEYNSSMLCSANHLIRTINRDVPSCIVEMNVIPGAVVLRVSPRSVVGRYVSTVSKVLFFASVSLFLFYRTATSQAS